MKLLVVGAGVAGVTAALTAEAEGAEVVVASGPAPQAISAGGAWDVAPPAPASLADRIRDLARERPEHPYARLGDDPVATVAAAHQRLLPALSIYRPLDLDRRGVLVATAAGRLRHAATAQRAVLALDDDAPGVSAVFALAGYRRIDAGYLTRGFAASADALGDGYRFVEVSIEYLRRRSDALLPPHGVAALADAEDARARLARTVRRACAGLGAQSALFPPILGLTDDTVAGGLSEAVGMRAGEVVAPLEGPQGLRLVRRLEAALADAGVERAGPVARIEVGANGTSAAHLEDGSELAPDAVLLATGGVLGGGIVVDGRDARAGVRGDASFRALDADGAVVADDLFVAGALLEGADTADGTGMGVACATGYAAARSVLGVR